jgi:hypothetical protein
VKHSNNKDIFTTVAKLQRTKENITAFHLSNAVLPVPFCWCSMNRVIQTGIEQNILSLPDKISK